jgi:hypothetical protein
MSGTAETCSGFYGYYSFFLKIKDNHSLKLVIDLYLYNIISTEPINPHGIVLIPKLHFIETH